MTESEIINYWKSLITNKDTLEHWDRLLLRNEPENKVPESFFSCFRPFGDGIEKVFSVIDKGNEIAQRAKEIFMATSVGYEPGDWYFLVKNPPDRNDEKIHYLTKNYLNSITEIAGFMENEALYNLSNKIQNIEIIDSKAPLQTNDDKLELELYDMMSDFRWQLKIENSVMLLEEALYQMTCLYDVAYYILWPLLGESSEFPDPFKASVELWKLNYEVRLDDYFKIKVYLK